MSNKEPAKYIELNGDEADEETNAIYNAGIPHRLAIEIEKCSIYPKEDKTKEDSNDSSNRIRITFFWKC